MRVFEMSMEQCRNERAEETGDPRENQRTNGIVRHDSHTRKSESPLELPAIIPITVILGNGGKPRQKQRRACSYFAADADRHALQLVLTPTYAGRGHWFKSRRLAYSPPTKAIRVQSPAGSVRILECGSRAGRCRWSVGFRGELLYPPPFHFSAAPYSPQSPSSALKTSLIFPSEITPGEYATMPNQDSRGPISSPLNIVRATCLSTILPPQFSPGRTNPQCSRDLRATSCTVAFTRRVSPRPLVHSHHKHIIRRRLAISRHRPSLCTSLDYRTHLKGVYQDCWPLERCNIYRVNILVHPVHLSASPTGGVGAAVTPARSRHWQSFPVFPPGRPGEGGSDEAVSASAWGRGGSSASQFSPVGQFEMPPSRSCQLDGQTIPVQNQVMATSRLATSLWGNAAWPFYFLVPAFSERSNRWRPAKFATVNFIVQPENNANQWVQPRVFREFTRRRGRLQTLVLFSYCSDWTTVLTARPV
ncbi:hypothetical protein PR048_022063 [Dryococelus australis]|uniref:Uncharacterized protein n=1 Tax=Dryococelus australis TaxID=614101 RepID=A0ABQ9GZZ7_9NEOP|nr:hypothetical protein PR048_022063 [Dryococelus australis]